MATRGITTATSALLVLGLVSGCGGGGPAADGPLSNPSDTVSSTTTAPSTSPASPTITAPTGITITARFAGGLGRTSITLPKGWVQGDRLANVQAAAQTRTGDEQVNLVLAPGASNVTIPRLAKFAARDFRASGGTLGTIHRPLTVNGQTFSYVTGKDSSGFDGTQFNVLVPLAAGGYGAIGVGFLFDPSVPQKVRTALYKPILASLTYH